MKLRVLFLKKIHILYSLIFIFLSVFLLLILFGTAGTNVSTTIKDNTIIKADLTGDGKEDMLYINTESDKYFLQVNALNKSYPINAKGDVNTLGRYYPYNPMKINLMDLTRDKIPEIFVQAMEKGFSIQHIFSWNGSQFDDLFCSNNNIMGVVDSKNNKTPKFISAFYSNSSINISYYMYLRNKIEKVDYTNNLPGKDELFSFINYIQALPYGEANKPIDIFSPGVTGSDISVIGKLASANKIYKFNDAFFADTKFNKDGEATEYRWTLNFKATPVSKDSGSENVSIIVKLKKTSQNQQSFKIYSLMQNDN